MLFLGGPTGGDAHAGHPSHPERPARLDAVLAGVADLALGDACVEVAPTEASDADLMRVHSAAYLADLEAFARTGGGDLDEDTYVRGDSVAAARRAAGAGLATIEALRATGDGVGFVAARPPGHHAERARGMGFCLLNNVAVAAAALAARGERVLVLDWDVHHGNGTQAIFYEDPRVLFVSTHEWPLYPGTGRPSEVGEAGGVGATVNVPLPSGATGDVLEAGLDRVAGPAIERFAPEWVLVSCGFDAHRDDPLASLALSAGDFGRLALLARSLAPRPGRLALFLEGGYDLEALRHSTVAVLSALLGDAESSEPPTHGGPGLDVVDAARAARDRAVDEAAAARDPSEDGPPRT